MTTGNYLLPATIGATNPINSSGYSLYTPPSDFTASLASASGISAPSTPTPPAMSGGCAWWDVYCHTGGSATPDNVHAPTSDVTITSYAPRIVSIIVGLILIAASIFSLTKTSVLPHG